MLARYKRNNYLRAYALSRRILLSYTRMRVSNSLDQDLTMWSRELSAYSLLISQFQFDDSAPCYHFAAYGGHRRASLRTRAGIPGSPRGRIRCRDSTPHHNEAHDSRIFTKLWYGTIESVRQCRYTVDDKGGTLGLSLHAPTNPWVYETTWTRTHCDHRGRSEGPMTSFLSD